MAEPTPEPTREPEPDDYVFDEYAYAEDNPGWDDEPPEPVEDTITVRPGERLPVDAGDLLRTYYAPGIGDVRVYARSDPNASDIDEGQILEADELGCDGDEPESKPKPPK